MTDRPVCLITGASAGIGAACAALAAQRGYDLALTYNTDAEGAARVAAGCEAEGARTLVVTGGFHTPALIGPGEGKAAQKPAGTDSYLIAYGEEALDAYAGYAAGLRHPGWYRAAWEATIAAGGPPDWQTLAVETATDFAGAQAAARDRVAFPQLAAICNAGVTGGP